MSGLLDPGCKAWTNGHTRQALRRYISPLSGPNRAWSVVRERPKGSGAASPAGVSCGDSPSGFAVSISEKKIYSLRTAWNTSIYHWSRTRFQGCFEDPSTRRLNGEA